jgi:hypothetical protein
LNKKKHNDSRLAKECRRKIDHARVMAKNTRKKYDFQQENYWMGQIEAYQNVLLFIGN